MEVKQVRELEGFREGQHRTLVEAGGKHYLVSSVPDAPDSDEPETLVFPCDEQGEPTSYLDVCGGSNVTHEQAIKELGTVLDGGVRSPRPGAIGQLYDALVAGGDDE